jgi:drug/metabolite transporter (DMT)-like permease
VSIQALSELLFKKAALATHIHAVDFSNLGVFVAKIFTNLELWAGLLLYIINFFVWITVLSQSDLSVAFPVASISYILVPLLSVVFLHEQTTFKQWAGIFLIVIGITLVIQSDHKKAKGCL